MSDYNDGAGAQAQQLAPAEYTSGTEKSHESENPHAREVVSGTEGTSKAVFGNQLSDMVLLDCSIFLT